MRRFSASPARPACCSAGRRGHEPEIAKNGGIAICAPIAPYAETRRAVRAMIEEHGAFIEIFVATPIEICEARDRKGLYAKARKGLIPEFTGVSNPHEEHGQPELRIDTRALAPDEAARHVIKYLADGCYLVPTGSAMHAGRYHCQL